MDAGIWIFTSPFSIRISSMYCEGEITVAGTSTKPDLLSALVFVHLTNVCGHRPFSLA
jgi:hypothetical protein